VCPVLPFMARDKVRSFPVAVIYIKETGNHNSFVQSLNSLLSSELKSDDFFETNTFISRGPAGSVGAGNHDVDVFHCPRVSDLIKENEMSVPSLIDR